MVGRMVDVVEDEVRAIDEGNQGEPGIPCQQNNLYPED